MARSLARLAGAINDTRQPVTFTYATAAVDHVAAGAAADGNDAAFIEVRGDIFPAPYLASYTPVAGDLVGVIFVSGSPLILGQPIGLPAF